MRARFFRRLHALEFHMIALISVQNIVLTCSHSYLLFVLGKGGAKRGCTRHDVLKNVHNSYNCKTCTEYAKFQNMYGMCTFVKRKISAKKTVRNRYNCTFCVRCRLTGPLRLIGTSSAVSMACLFLLVFKFKSATLFLGFFILIMHKLISFGKNTH